MTCEKLAGQREYVMPDLSLQVFEEFLLKFMNMRFVSFHVDFASVVIHQRNRYESLAGIIAQKLLLFVSLYFLFDRDHVYFGEYIAQVQQVVEDFYTVVFGK